VLEKALQAADWDGFAARLAEAKQRGRLRGIGNHLEVTTPPTLEMGGIRFNADATVTIVTGTLNDGQGHWTPFAQVLSGEAGCAGSLPAVMNVLIDALRPVGVTQIDMPATPEKV
jgi:carbon-monoxide dehydrogenase large subunit